MGGVMVIMTRMCYGLKVKSMDEKSNGNGKYSKRILLNDSDNDSDSEINLKKGNC